jgi:hypothetical protein
MLQGCRSPPTSATAGRSARAGCRRARRRAAPGFVERPARGPVRLRRAREEAAAAPDPARFEPEAAFLFLPDGRRLALYDRHDRGAFDLALLDQDGDGIAESRWTKDGGQWILQKDITTPWLSQANLAFLPQDDKRADATARLSFLAGSPPR